jgi:hypothetical protein
MLQRGADGFTSPPKEGALLVFIAFKNPLASAGFEPANVGSTGKHVNDYTTEETSNFINLN